MPEMDTEEITAKIVQGIHELRQPIFFCKFFLNLSISVK